MGRRRGTSAFPVARIKKMMQSDDDVGKIATVTPVLVAKALELMMEYVLKEAAHVAQERHTKTVTPQHLKTCVMNNESFDFLRDVLKRVQSFDDEKPKRKRKRARSPVETRRVRRGRDDAAVKHPENRAQVPDNPGLENLPLPPHVGVPEPPKHDEEDDDYDEEDVKPELDQDSKKDESVQIPVETPSATERMSVSALLS